MKKEFRLISLDIDGTILNEKGEISGANRQAIAEARKKGIDVVLSTGRSIFTCSPITESLQLDSYLVTLNGGEVWDGSGNLVERYGLEVTCIQNLWELAKKYRAQFWGVTTEKVWSNEFPADIFAHQWLKFGFDIEDDLIRKKVIEELSQDPRLEISNSSLTNIEVNAAGVNKAKGVANVCRRLGISMDEVMAIGDSLNDVAMIQQAGCGVAMGNAQDMVKEVADWVTGTNREDGVARAIRHWVLQG
ncbi:Cof-type HAD-IIB family hydrolase [Thermoactinomyces mirandus]|uniref:HAD family phosphatase n=1 Tax=Thermoactinomyces mirandus TaxID=2756294 RepID=A0A7W1XQ55_9BACL|nr:Cof-type HAD-IIB family hydrolase [Thermoactinomyces mirandus]MBA4601141.1 HAD family phosphatase [Thermoactinomyces mirandus]